MTELHKGKYAVGANSTLGNSFSWMKNGKWMKLNKVKSVSTVLNSTPGIPILTAQSKILPYDMVQVNKTLGFHDLSCEKS